MYSSLDDKEVLCIELELRNCWPIRRRDQSMEIKNCHFAKAL